MSSSRWFTCALRFQPKARAASTSWIFSLMVHVCSLNLCSLKTLHRPELHQCFSSEEGTGWCENHLVSLHLLAILTGQGYISEVLALSQFSKGIVLKITIRSFMPPSTLQWHPTSSKVRGRMKVFQDCVEVHMQHIQQGLRLVMIFMITKLVAKIKDENDFDGNSWEWQQS